MWQVEGLYYPCSENKGTDQLRGYRKADLRLFFAYAKSRFSHDEAQMPQCQPVPTFTLCTENFNF